MKLRIVLIAALGLILACYLIFYVGLAAVLSAAAAVGWWGFALLCAYGLALFVPLGAAWRVLLGGVQAVHPAVFTWARMVRDAATEVLPFSQLGGIVLGARAAIVQGVAAPTAYGSTIVDVTTELLAQIGFIALGVAIFIARAPQNPRSGSLPMVFLAGLTFAVIAGGVFLALQRYGHRFTTRLAARLLPGAAAATAKVGDTLDAIYATRGRVALSVALHFGAWIASAFGSWIAFRLIGCNVDFGAVVAIESFVCAARSAAVFIPNALGVQEAAYAVLAPAFGVGAQYGLALSLLKRARDVALGVPILAIWQGIEGRRALSGPTA